MKNKTQMVVLLASLFAGAAEAATITNSFTVSGSWTAPAGVTAITVEAWGGGGAGGGNSTSSDGGGGGGGGAYARSVLTVVPGTTYTVTVGAGGVAVAGGTGGAGGDSWFDSATTLLAKGGAGGDAPVGGAGGIGGVGGAAVASIGMTTFSGGDGGTGRNNKTGQGGPGGSSAGTAANGTSGALTWNTVTAAAPPAGGGIGGDGGASGANGAAPLSGNGGGGGGSGDVGVIRGVLGASLSGGNGAAGRVDISYTGAGPVTYYHDTTTAVNIGFDGTTNVTGADQVIPPIIIAGLSPVNTCPVASARSRNHPIGLYTHSRWYLNSDYPVATAISANPAGSASLRGGRATDSVVVSLYDYDAVTGAKVLIGSSPAITLTGGATTTTYAYTISSPAYVVPAGHRLMLEYSFSQTLATDRARVYCSATASFITLTETPAPLDHLEIRSSGTGLTCAANTLTIVACQDAACATPYTAGLSGTLSATGTPTVNWDGNTGGAPGAGFVIPAGSSSVTKNVQVATAGSVTFGVSTAAPAPTNVTACNFGDNAPASNNCVFTASTAGFIFSDTATGIGYTIPAQVSGIATPMLYLRAVQASTANPAVCTPAIVGSTTTVNMGYTCNDPAACQPGSLVTVNATPVAPSGTGVNLTFDANGSAPITARYDDVGRITLNASVTATPFGGATAITLNGSTNPFVVKPDHFDLIGIQQTAAPNLANPGAVDALGPIFVKAGELFSVAVAAKNALGNVTPNYGNESTLEGVNLTWYRVAPAGGVAGSLGGTKFTSGAGFQVATKGVATFTDLSWSEVGIMQLMATVLSGSYLGGSVSTPGSIVAGSKALTVASANNIMPGSKIAVWQAGFDGAPLLTTVAAVTGTTITLASPAITTVSNTPVHDIYGVSLNVGRFIPDHFDTVVTGPMSCPTGLTCPPGGLAYAGQAFTANVYARNAGGGITQNYDGTASTSPNFAKDVTLTAWDALGSTTTQNPPAGAPGLFIGTSAAVAASSFSKGMTESPGTPGAPTYAFAATPTGPTDVYIRAVDTDGATSLCIPASVSNEGGVKVVSGRIKVSNAYGSDLLPLTLIARAQYFDGTAWADSLSDNVTTLALGGSYPVGAGTTSVTLTPSSGTLAGGSLSIRLSAPGTKGVAAISPTAPAYLQLVPGTATFGVYKGGNEFIYMRESY